MEALGTRRVVRIFTTALIYAVLTLLFSEYSFGGLQLRFAEMLMILCLYNKDSVPALTIGCFAANVFGPYGAADVIIGTVGTFAAALLIRLLRKYIGVPGAAAITAAVNAPLVALVLMFSGDQGSFIENLGLVAAGELISVGIFGAIFRIHIKKIKRLQRFFIDPEEEPEKA